MNSHRATSETKIETNPDWSQIIAKIINEKLMTNGTLSSLATTLAKTTSITKKYDNPIGQMEMWLETFFKKILEDEFEKLYSNRKPKSTTFYISNLMMELNEIPVIIEFTTTILGTFISSNDSILQHFSIRKVKPKDIDWDMHTGRMFNFPDGILTFKIKGDQNQGHVKMSNILDVFRLSSVSHYQLRGQSSSLIWSTSFGTSSPIPKDRIRYKYEITDKDIANFMNFQKYYFQYLNKNLVRRRICLDSA